MSDVTPLYDDDQRCEVCDEVHPEHELYPTEDDVYLCRQCYVAALKDQLRATPPERGNE